MRVTSTKPGNTQTEVHHKLQKPFSGIIFHDQERQHNKEGDLK